MTYGPPINFTSFSYHPPYLSKCDLINYQCHWIIKYFPIKCFLFPINLIIFHRYDQSRPTIPWSSSISPNSPYIFTPLTQTIKSQWCFVIYTASLPYKDMVLHITEYPLTRAAWLKKDWGFFPFFCRRHLEKGHVEMEVA